MQPASNMGIRFRTHFKPFGLSKKREKAWARMHIRRIEGSIRKRLAGFLNPDDHIGTLRVLYQKITEINRRFKDGTRK